MAPVQVAAHRNEPAFRYPESEVLQTMMWTPRSQQPEVLTNMLSCPDAQVREDVLAELRNLRPTEWMSRSACVARVLDDSPPRVCFAALQVLQRLPAGALSCHCSEIGAQLQHEDWRIREASLQTLKKMHSAVLTPLAETLVEMRKDPHSKVRVEAQKTIQKLDPEVVFKLLYAGLDKISESEQQHEKFVNLVESGQLFAFR
eukprot:TRINITY_DN91986_c0_g1_i1.p1 TRINITY_DN91986_c0_g1~~TRINITY_DN91986_c0_g1_i1.p1  ORF type:complete len:221 (+),score=39.97 TRINITY_DN91986_c0_g1_i1:58-663(+)